MSVNTRERAVKRSIDPRRHSRRVVDGDTQAPARAMLRAAGFADEDFHRPQIGVASTWANLTPCNMHIGDLAREACAGIDGGGGKSVLFNTITVSDGISMGTPGMRYSLVSRDIIADSIEAVAGPAGLLRVLRGSGRGQALRLPPRGRGGGETGARGLEAARDPHAPLVRERHHRGDRARRLDECGAASAGHRT